MGLGRVLPLRKYGTVNSRNDECRQKIVADPRLEADENQEQLIQAQQVAKLAKEKPTKAAMTRPAASVSQLRRRKAETRRERQVEEQFERRRDTVGFVRIASARAARLMADGVDARFHC